LGEYHWSDEVFNATGTLMVTGPVSSNAGENILKMSSWTEMTKENELCMKNGNGVREVRTESIFRLMEIPGGRILLEVAQKVCEVVYEEL